MTPFAERVRRRAEQLGGLSNAVIARRAGIQERTFGQYMIRGSEPKFAVLLRICDALLTHPNYLTGYSDDPEPPPRRRGLPP
jgi:hypothetical protein